jgi:hypothetical protein
MQHRSPQWGKLYRIGALGILGLALSPLSGLPYGIRQFYLLGWLLTIFGLIGRWVAQNERTLAILDDPDLCQTESQRTLYHIPCIESGLFEGEEQLK